MNPTSLVRPRRHTAHFRLLLVATLAMLLSGCTMRALVGVNVNPDGSGVFEVSMAFDEELRTLLEQDSTEPIDWSDPASFDDSDSPADIIDDFPEGATVDPYSDDDFEGFTMSVEFGSLDELEQILEQTSSEGEEAFPFRITSDGGGRFELVTDGNMFEGAQLDDEETEMFSPSMVADLFDIQLRVQLPGEVVSTNADETDEGVMIWRLDPTADDPLSPTAVSEVSSSSLSTLLILVGLLIVGAGAAGIWLMGRPPTPGPSEAGEAMLTDDPTLAGEATLAGETSS